MKKDIILAGILLTLGILTRTYLHIAPNVEFVTAITIASGYFIKEKRLAGAVILGIMLVSDLIIGNSNIFLFTWTGFVLPLVLGVVVSKKSLGFAKKLVTVEASGILATIFFFLWTNFGVVLTTNMYSKDLSGLLASYVNALPFLANQLVGNLIFVPLIFCMVYVIHSKLGYNESTKLLIK